MAESNKTTLDVLPDEVILKILGNLEGMADRSNMAQVCHKFTRLAKDTKWRKNLFISSEEIKRFSTNFHTRLSYEKALEKELKLSNFLEMLCAELDYNVREESEFIDSIDPKYVMNSTNFENLEQKELLYLIKEKIEKSSNYNSVCSICDFQNASHFIAFFRPKNGDVNYGRLTRYNLVNTTFIDFEGKDSTMLEKIIEISADNLRVALIQCPITLPLLEQLSECTKMRFLRLGGELILPSNVDETNLPKIDALIVSLEKLSCSDQSFQTSSIIANIFYSQQLSTLHIPWFFLKGLANEICSRCPNLKYLDINMKKETNIDILLNFCTTVIDIILQRMTGLEMTNLYQIDHRFSPNSVDFEAHIYPLEDGHIILVGRNVIVGYGNLFEEYEHVIEEYGNVIEEYGNVIEEYGNVIEEYGNVIEEDGNVIEEYENVIEEDGNVIEEDGNVIEDENVIEEDGNVIEEDGNVIEEYENVIEEYGNVIEEYENVIEEYGNVIEENENVIDEDGNVMEEDGHIMEEDGSVIEEDGHVIEEDGNVIKENQEML